MGTIVVFMEPINPATASAVAAAIADAGLPEQVVARTAGLSAKAWRRRIKGHTSFTVAELSLIARACGVSWGALADAAQKGADS